MRIYQEKLGSQLLARAQEKRETDIMEASASSANLRLTAETEKMSGKIFAMERL
jgi:hypothetical protein